MVQTNIFLNETELIKIKCERRLEAIVRAQFTRVNRTHVLRMSLNKNSSDIDAHSATIISLRDRSFLKQLLHKLEEKRNLMTSAYCHLHQLSLPYQSKRNFPWTVFAECENICPQLDCEHHKFFTFLPSASSNGEMRVMLSPLMYQNIAKPKVQLLELLCLLPSLLNFWFGFSVRRLTQALLNNRRLKKIFTDNQNQIKKHGKSKKIKFLLKFFYAGGTISILIAMVGHLHLIMVDYYTDNEITRMHLKRTLETDSPAISICLPLHGVLSPLLQDRLQQLHLRLQRKEKVQNHSENESWCNADCEDEIKKQNIQVQKLLLKARNATDTKEGEIQLWTSLTIEQLFRFAYNYFDMLDSITFVSHAQQTFTLWLRMDAYEDDWRLLQGRSLSHWGLILDQSPEQEQGDLESFHVLDPEKSDTLVPSGKLKNNFFLTEMNDGNLQPNCLQQTFWNRSHLKVCGLELTSFFYRKMACVKTQLNFPIRTFELKIGDHQLLQIQLNEGIPYRMEETLDGRPVFGYSYVHQKDEMPSENSQANLAGHINAYIYKRYSFTELDRKSSDCADYIRLNSLRGCYLKKHLEKHQTCPILLPLRLESCPEQTLMNVSLQLKREEKRWLVDCANQLTQKPCMQQYFKLNVHYTQSGKGVQKNDELKTSSNPFKTEDNFSSTETRNRTRPRLITPLALEDKLEQTEIRLSSEFIETVVEYLPKMQRFELLLTIGTVLSIWLNLEFWHLIQLLQWLIRRFSRAFCAPKEMQSSTKLVSDENKTSLVNWLRQNERNKFIHRQIQHSDQIKIQAPNLDKQNNEVQHVVKSMCNFEERMLKLNEKTIKINETSNK